MGTNIMNLKLIQFWDLLIQKMREKFNILILFKKYQQLKQQRKKRKEKNNFKYFNYQNNPNPSKC